MSWANDISLVESNNKFRNLSISIFLRYEYEYVWICELVESSGVQP